MKRRRFITSTLLGGLAIPAITISNCISDNKNKNVQHNIAQGLEEATLLQLQQGMQEGSFSSEEITSWYLSRIETLDTGGPMLRSVMEVNPDALDRARKMDEERKAGKIRGLLHGIPVMVKDNIDTADKMQTTAGSLAMAGFIAPEDAFIVKKLRDAGAVLLGKTNLSEWANIRSTRSTSGWSARGGQVQNPYDTTRNPCGSSSGSGVAVSANLCSVAIGTETDGSIVCPSGVNGIVGIKPTLGLISRHGIIPIAHSQDTAGPMARTVTDAAIFLGILCGQDKSDMATLHDTYKSESDYTYYLDKNALNGARIGIIRDFMGFHPGVDDLMESVFESMRSWGAILVDVNCGSRRKDWNEAEYLVLQYELKTDLNSYLSGRPDAPVKSLGEIIKFNQAHAELEMPWFGQEFFLMAEERGDLTSLEYREALELSKNLSRNAIESALNFHQVSVLIAPTNAPAWKTDPVNGDHFIGGTSDLAAVSGYPSITVPAGFVHGLPVGISFIGKAWDEGNLIRFAYAFEQMTQARKKPVL